MLDNSGIGLGLSRRNFLAQSAAVATLLGSDLAVFSQESKSAINVVDKYGRLRAKGNAIVGKDDVPAVVHGMSLFWSQWMGQYYNADAIAWLRDDWKCTMVRAAMGIEHGGYLEHPAQEKEKVCKVVEAAIELGMYVIIDWHDHDAHEHTQESKAFFTEMAKAYGKSPNVIFELWNEPLNTHDWSKVIKPYHEAVIPGIREHSDNLIVCGTQTWSQDVDKAAKDPVAADNVAYTLHFYAGSHKQSLRDKTSAALDKGIAIMATEWGACDANGSGELAVTETQKWLEFMEKNKISWCNWSVADKVETSAALNPGAAGTGGWSVEKISGSGRLVRDVLRTQA